MRDLLDLVPNVILIKCIFRSGNPGGGSGFWAKGSSWATERTKGVSLRATGSRGGRILTQQGGFQVSRQGDQGEQGANRVHKLNYISCMYAMNERHQLYTYNNNNRNECC